MILWQCPTFARPIVALTWELQRFTAVFRMGTGGATAQWSPDCLAVERVAREGAAEVAKSVWGRGLSVRLSEGQTVRFSDGDKERESVKGPLVKWDT